MAKPRTENKEEYNKLRLIIRKAMNETQIEATSKNRLVANCATWQWNKLEQISKHLGEFTD